MACFQETSLAKNHSQSVTAVFLAAVFYTAEKALVLVFHFWKTEGRFSVVGILTAGFSTKG